MKRLGLIAVLALAGCAAPDDTREVMQQYRYQPVDLIVERLGYPQSETTIMDRKTYVWSSSVRNTSPVSTTTTGYIGSKPITVTTTVPETSTYSCTLRVFVDGQNRVDGYDFKGEAGPCMAYSRQLKR